MKFILPLFCACSISFTGFAQQPFTTPPLISTTGTSEIRVIPDLADLFFAVEVRNPDLDTARKLQAERTSKVLAALRAAGVAETELSSSQVQISPYFETSRQEESATIKFFTVSQSITATLHDVKKITEITATAVTAGVTQVGGVALRTSQLRKYRDETRNKAILAAKEKAVALSAALDAKIGRPFSITEDGSHGLNALSLSQVQGNAFGAADAAPDNATMATFALGSISVSASVSVSFVLE